MTELVSYARIFGEDEIFSRMRDFHASSSEVYRREHGPGHFTGSALVVDPSLRRVALTHHRKLNRWMQFGGHADGDDNLARVALKEAEEESGLARLHFVAWEEWLGFDHHPAPFDLDIHTIPPFQNLPEHLHYDVRYLLTTESLQLTVSHESHDVAWFALEEARTLTDEACMLRMFDKVDWLRTKRAAAIAP